jgi:hypothetical protein
MINLHTSQGDSVAIEPERLDALRSSLRGSIAPQGRGTAR